MEQMCTYSKAKKMLRCRVRTIIIVIKLIMPKKYHQRLKQCRSLAMRSPPNNKNSKIASIRFAWYFFEWKTVVFEIVENVVLLNFIMLCNFSLFALDCSFSLSAAC